MTTQNETIIKREERKLFIEREFNAPVEEVWKAWTESHLLDQWWAPKPWKAKTKSMDFRDGGQWLYSMIGPNGEESFCRADFDSVVPLKSYKGDDAFCDKDGNPDHSFPVMHWNINFEKSSNGTLVKVEVSFDSEADLEKIIEMGFQEGFTAAHSNLDELLQRR